MNTSARGARRTNAQRRQPVAISGPSPLPTQRRRRSRSVDRAQPVQEQRPPNLTRNFDASYVDQNKRKKPGNPSLPSSTSRSFLVAIDDANSDRGRKLKVKPRSHNRQLAENAPHASTSCLPESQASSVKRERSKSRDSLKLPSKGTASDVEGSGRDVLGTIDAHAEYSGPPTAAELAKMKRELDFLKKSAHDSKKVVKKQSKVIEEQKQQDNILRQKLKESESQLSKLQSKVKKSEEAISTVESNLQCQICMDLLYRPYALSPCGHILCVTCLQEWFRKAPDDGMYDDGDPDYLLRRRKTCPCCRTNIRHRPIPVFVIKAIVAAIVKVKGSQAGSSVGRDQAPNDSDPWEGLFPEDDEDIDDYGASDDEDGEEEDVDEDVDEDSSWYDDVFSYTTGSDEEPYDGPYVYPQWEPPSVPVDEEEYLFDRLEENDLNCLRRGVTMGMLHEYEVEYTHHRGLVARDDADNRVYLGWNIRLSADDEDGRSYMQHLADDIVARPERWSIIEGDEGSYEAHLLVREEENFEYQDTESENYMDLE